MVLVEQYHLRIQENGATNKVNIATDVCAPGRIDNFVDKNSKHEQRQNSSLFNTSKRLNKLEKLPSHLTQVLEILNHNSNILCDCNGSFLEMSLVSKT
jgi:hypothetical protein